MEERDKGWLAGPFKPSDPECPRLLSNRFGVKQKEKVRCVDYMSASLINSTTFAEKKVSLHSTDVIASAVAEWCSVRSDCGKSAKLSAKSYDLKSAYKQIGMSAKSRPISGLVLKDPDGNPQVFQALALPFGATQSVYAFNRLSRCLWSIGVMLFWTVFYDDFCLFTEPCLERSWLYDHAGDKCTDFSTALHALGVKVCLSRLSDGVITIANTESGIKELVDALEDTVAKGRVSKSDARKIAGRMSFAVGQVFGRLAKACLKVFYSVIESRSNRLSEDMVRAMEMYVFSLRHDPPRTINLAVLPCAYIYTDASLEPKDGSNVAGLGGVLVGPAGVPMSFFLYFPTGSDLLKLGIDIDSKCIFLLEMLASCLAFKIWAASLKNINLVLYVDNEGAKSAMIAGSSNNRVANEMLKVQVRSECQFGMVPWISCAPSHSNISDHPWRELISELQGWPEARKVEVKTSMLEQVGENSDRFQ